MDILTKETVRLRARAADKEDAIRQAGELLVKAGCVPPSYVDGMLAREHVLSTYVGHGIAIPHGQLHDLAQVHRSGVSALQLPEGVEWEPGETAYLVFGLAAKSEEHAGILANLVEVLQNPQSTQQLIQATDPVTIVERLTRERSDVRWN
jgi:mannitol/fructose-specific phosphotransferase system IIA component